MDRCARQSTSDGHYCDKHKPGLHYSSCAKLFRHQVRVPVKRLSQLIDELPLLIKRRDKQPKEELK
jgi:hypothetical protein